MYILSPSILAADFSRLGEQVKDAQRGGAKWLHIDVMDGHFVPSISFGFPVIQSLRPVTDMLFDVHLMIEEPQRYLKEFAKAGADSITVHWEACRELMPVLLEIGRCGCRRGISVKPQTPVEVVFPYLKELEMVLIMTVEPGYGGQSYLHAMTEKLRLLQSYCKEHDLHPDIQVDGGIREETMEEARSAGANVFVCGTAVFGAETEKNARKLTARFQEWEAEEKSLQQDGTVR